MAKKKVEIEEEKANKDNVAIILQLKIDSLKKEQADGNTHQDEFCKQVVQLYNDGKITKADIFAIQEHHLMGDLIEITAHFKVGPTGVTYYEAREQAHKVQFMAISYAQENGLDVVSAFKNSMRPMEETIDHIFNGTYDKGKLAILQSLPHVSVWDHKLGAETWAKHFM